MYTGRVLFIYSYTCLHPSQYNIKPVLMYQQLNSSDSRIEFHHQSPKHSITQWKDVISGIPSAI